jgi:hypothetical protein
MQDEIIIENLRNERILEIENEKAVRLAKQKRDIEPGSEASYGAQNIM